MEFVGQFEGQRLHSVHVNLWTSIFLVCKTPPPLFTGRISCEIFGHGSRGAHGTYLQKGPGFLQVVSNHRYGRPLEGILYFCPKQRLGHKGEASCRDGTLTGPALCSGFLIVIRKRKAGEDHCRWLLLSHDYARLGSYLSHTVNGHSIHIREYAGFN